MLLNDQLRIFHTNCDLNYLNSNSTFFINDEIKSIFSKYFFIIY